MSDSLVFDVGKTHVKITVLDDNGLELFSHRTANRTVMGGAYPSLDIDGIWDWFIHQCRDLSPQFNIGGIAVATHGAAAVLIDRQTGKPLLPPMDYEHDTYPDEATYHTIRPPFEETKSPRLPCGLNLGRQLHFQLGQLSTGEKDRLLILTYPSYWSWRMTGIASCEVTSLGCHTDLWNVEAGCFSSLVEALGVERAFPPLAPTNTPLGPISPGFANMTGLPPTVQVLPGLHDSNAGYYPHLSLRKAERPAVISTGTWSIVLNAETPLGALDEARDMLANVDGNGDAVATARYMGGREFAEICERTNSDIATSCNASDLQAIVDDNVLALPCFSGASGPFGRRSGRITGRVESGKALATLYSALMLNELLTSLESSNDIVIEGSFAANELLCGVLAALRPNQRLLRYPRGGGVVDGCFHALHPDKPVSRDSMTVAPPLKLAGLDTYQSAWKQAVQSHCLKG